MGSILRDPEILCTIPTLLVCCENSAPREPRKDFTKVLPERPLWRPSKNTVGFCPNKIWRTGIVPENCGFALQNRGFGMNIDCDDDHPNVYAPSKRPYHTILPGILTWAENDELYATLSNMGGNMQPQGHMQLTVGMVDHGLDPQAAIDFPRFCIAEGTQNGAVYMEKEVLPSVVEELVERGHTIQNGVDGHGRAIFGRAQIIRKDPKTGVWCAGTDGRADGQAIGY